MDTTLEVVYICICEDVLLDGAPDIAESGVGLVPNFAETCTSDETWSSCVTDVYKPSRIESSGCLALMMLTALI